MSAYFNVPPDSLANCKAASEGFAFTAVGSGLGVWGLVWGAGYGVSVQDFGI